MSDERTQIAAYVGYLDKEMTIMGVLTGFCVVGGGLVLDRTLGASEAGVLGKLWMNESPSILLLAACLFVAGLLFYRQRSLLAFYYGQLLLTETRLSYVGGRGLQLLEDADAWDTWCSYDAAFWFVFAAAAYAVIAIVSGATQPPFKPGIWILGVPGTIAILAAALVWYVQTVFAHNDEPWADWLRGEPPDPREVEPRTRKTQPQNSPEPAKEPRQAG